MVKNCLISTYFLTFIAYCALFSSTIYSRSFVGPAGSFYDTILLMGAIQYPHAVNKIPMVRVYCGGNQISCEANDENKKLTFTIPIHRYQTEFYVLVAENIDWVMEEGLVKYLKVPAHEPYKLYTLERIKDDSSREILVEAHLTTRIEQYKVSYRWSIKEVQLQENGRIPDDAIIVYDDPDHYSALKEKMAGSEGATAFELPELEKRADLLEVVGSEKELHEHATKLLLSSLDYDTIHARVPQAVNHKAKTIVALTT